MAKGKVIQKVEAWRYPCNDLLSNNKFGFIILNSCFTKKVLARLNRGCVCGKSCKPQKIKIKVEVC